MRKLLSFLLLLPLPALPLPALAQGVPNTAFVVSVCGTPPSAYQVGQNRPQTMDTGGRNCDNLTGPLTIVTTAQATLPSLSSGNNPLYENLFGSLFVQPSFNGTLVDLTHGLPVNVVAGAPTASTFGAAFPATGTAIGVKNGANMVNLAADGSSNLLVSLATALPAGANLIGGTKLIDTGGANAASVSAGGALKVDNSAVTQPSNITQFGSSNVVTGTGASGAGIPRVTISNDSSLAANQSTNVNQFGGSAVTTGTGTGGAGIPRVTVSSDSTVGLVAGTAIIGKVGIDQTTPGTTNGVQVNAALPAGANLIGKTGIDQTTPGTTNAVSLAQIGATTVSSGNGTSGAGVQRVAIASDNTAFSVNATPTAATTGGATPYHLAGGTAASTNSTSIKGSAGTLYSVSAINTTATLYYLRIYDSSSAPTCSSATGAKHSFPIPASTTGAGFAIPLGAVGEIFSSGIGYCVTGGGSDTDNTNAAAGIFINASYL